MILIDHTVAVDTDLVDKGSQKRIDVAWSLKEVPEFEEQVGSFDEIGFDTMGEFADNRSPMNVQLARAFRKRVEQVKSQWVPCNRQHHLCDLNRVFWLFRMFVFPAKPDMVMLCRKVEL
jgi:hypothetical protein